MDDLRNLSDPNSLLHISNGLQKLCKSIQKQKTEEKIAENNIKEIEFLKEQCQHSNVQLSLLACQAFVHLTEERVLQSGKVLTLFVSMLTSASESQTTAITEGIISLLMHDLVHRVDQLAPNQIYQCPFGLKPPQHPLILVLQKRSSNVNDIVAKINSICNHHDKRIKDNSIEFLSPVFLYVLCNPSVLPDTKPIWSCLLAQCVTSAKAMTLVRDVFSWSRYGSPAACLNISTLLNETIEFLLNSNRRDDALDLQIHQIAILKDIVAFGYDPRPSLIILARALSRFVWTDSKQATDFHNYVLIMCAEWLHSVSTVYFIDVLNVVKYIIETKSYGNIVTLSMILDGLIIRWANATTFLSADCRNLCQHIITYITSSQPQCSPKTISSSSTQPNWACAGKYQHANIAVAYDLAIWSEQLLLQYPDGDLKYPNLAKFVLQLQRSEHIHRKLQLLLRALLLLPSNMVNDDHWIRIWNIVMGVVKKDLSVSIDMVYLVLYLLANESNGRRQLEILRGLSEFALVKENIPLILNTYRALATSSSIALQTVAIDLHVRLWKNESRAYQFLHKMLSTELKVSRKADAWEMNIVKANAIKEICELKPSQHGKDLVVHLSEILNAASDERNDLATSLALDAIILLCTSHTVNIASTWKALGGKFTIEQRPRSTRSLCEFFGEVPLLQSPTADYETLFYDALRQLWAYITDYDTAVVIEPALRALKNYNTADLALKHVPDLFQENLKIPSEYQKQIVASADSDTLAPLTARDIIPYIPGECWIQLLEKVNQSAIEAAVDLVCHLIETEISQFRSGVYMLTGGRTEPNELTQLHARSPLRAITKYVAMQAKLPYPENTGVLINCLRCLSRKYSKPIPPFDWFFLLDLLDKTFAGEESPYRLRSYCLRLAANQIANSGSARNLIENYLEQFRTSERYNEETECVLELMPQICHGCNADILRRILHDVAEFAYDQSRSCNFEKDCLMEVMFRTLVPIYEERCLIAENVEIITQLFTKYYELLDGDEKFFRSSFSDSLIKLPTDELMVLTTPSSWTPKTFQKAVTVRGKLCDARINYPTDSNSLVWLNAIVANADSAEQQQAVYSLVFNTLTAQRRPERPVFEWLMHFLEKMQSSITANDTRQCQYLMGLFILGISLLSGLSVLSDTAPTPSPHAVALFAESLAVLEERATSTDLMIRVYEFLNYFSTTKAIFTVGMYSAMRNALMCCKNSAYFLQKTNWTKFIALK